MADIKYNVSQLFKSAFGVNSPVYITPQLQKSSAENISYKGLATLPD